MIGNYYYIIIFVIIIACIVTRAKFDCVELVRGTM